MESFTAMKYTQLPVPEITDEMVSQYTRKQVKNRVGPRQLKPPKLKSRKLQNRLKQNNQSRSAQFISFRGDYSDLMQLQQSSVYDESLDESYFQQCFTRITKIGEGSFGKVFKVRCKNDGLLYAVKMSKELLRSEKYRKERLEEVRRYEQFSEHENCVRFYKAWEEDHRLFMQMELCHENLEQYLNHKKQISEDKIWSILLDLLLALKSLHDKNLIHLDIKLDNILIGDDNCCKLADFGLVIDVDMANRHETTEGDPRYIAPELMQGHFSKAADIFSLGIAILELSSFLELPANGPLWQQLRSGILPDGFINDKSKELQAIIKSMMSPEPQMRPTVDELLNHGHVSNIQYKRMRWNMIKKFKQRLRYLRRKTWSRLCNLHQLIVKLLVYTFGHFKLLGTFKDRIKSIGELHDSPHTLFSKVPSSTPIANGKRFRSSIDTCFGTDSSGWDISHCGTPDLFVNNNIVNSPPLTLSHQYNIRSRKDLTKSSFSFDISHCSPQKNTTNILCLEDFEPPQSSFVNSYILRSLRKDIFNDDDSILHSTM